MSKITNLNHLKLVALQGKADTAAKIAELTQTVTDAVTELEETKQDKPTMQTVTLAAAGWTDNAQTVTVNGLLADEAAQMVSVSPAAGDWAVCGAHGIDISAIADGSMTFTAITAPSSDVTVYVSIHTV